jgi:hypothetical protein
MVLGFITTITAAILTLMTANEHGCTASSTCTSAIACYRARSMIMLTSATIAATSLLRG